MTLDEHLEGYKNKHFKNLSFEKIWNKVDINKSRSLDRDETKKFIEAILENAKTDKEKIKRYDPANFDNLFNEYDYNKNEVIEKDEMAIFIKKVFSDPKPEELTISEHLGTYCQHFEGGAVQIEKLWNANDENHSGILNMKECIKFIYDLIDCVDKSMMHNYQPESLDRHYKHVDVD